MVILRVQLAFHVVERIIDCVFFSSESHVLLAQSQTILLVVSDLTSAENLGISVHLVFIGNVLSCERLCRDLRLVQRRLQESFIASKLPLGHDVLLLHHHSLREVAVWLSFCRVWPPLAKLSRLVQRLCLDLRGPTREVPRSRRMVYF